MKDSDAIRGGTAPSSSSACSTTARLSLRMPTWALQNTKWDWKAFLRGVFRTHGQQRATDSLFSTSGATRAGLDVGDQIVGHLLPKPVPREPVVRRVRYRRVTDDLNALSRHLGQLVPGLGSRPRSTRSTAFTGCRRDSDDDPRGHHHAGFSRRSPVAPGCWWAPRTVRPPSSSRRPCGGTGWARSSVSRPAAISAGSTAARSSSCACRIPASNWTCRSSASSPTATARCRPAAGRAGGGDTWRHRGRTRCRGGGGDGADPPGAAITAPAARLGRPAATSGRSARSASIRSGESPGCRGSPSG